MSVRTQRRDPGASRATVRDLLLLERVGRVAGAFDSRHAERFMGSSRAAARRRLRKLLDMGYLKVHLEAENLAKPNWYTLAPRARRELALHFDREPEEYPVRRGLPRQLEHHRQIVNHLVDIEVAAARRTGVELVRSQLPAPHREAGVLVPDVVVDLRVYERSVRLAVEVDMATETPNTIAGKALGYASVWKPGLVVLLSVPSVRRRNRLLLRLGEEDFPEGMLFIAVQEELTSRSILSGGPWRTQVLGADGVLRAPVRDPLGGDHEGRSP